jgi:hypothetical protein
VSFVTALALAVGFLVAVPYFAHRLRRRRADDRPFAAAHLVPAAPPRARRRSQLDDVALFGTRGLAVLALAVLGASPLVRCSRLSLQRSSGASVAMTIVVDDSMSMRAMINPDPKDGVLGGKRLDRKTRFEAAREGARELLASAREGDAVALVLAGAPARVALAATTDLGAARAALDGLKESDRATDLDGAITIARALVSQLPQVDRRVVVLSDLADGQPDAPAIGEGGTLPVWVALPELSAPGAFDCGVLSADRVGARVKVKIACSHEASAAGRELVLMEGENVVAKVLAPAGSLSGGSLRGEATLTIGGDPNTQTEERGALIVKLTGSDAIAADDTAPVMVEAGPGAVAVVADTADEGAATGGAPVVEQALAALNLDIAVRPLPVLPDRAEDLSSFVGIILDDPPGFTPEQRHALAAFIADGKVALLALGPRAASAPLGASFEPALTHGVGWAANTSPGADAASARAALVEGVTSLIDLGASHRATLAPDDARAFEPLLAWQDGAPMVARRALGRGEIWIVTLPFAVETSDLTLRPGFLSLLDAWTEKARLRAAPRRGEVGVPWNLPSARAVSVEGPAGPIEVAHDDQTLRATPPVIGTYRVKFEGNKTELHVAAPVVRELDLRPRAIGKSSQGQGLGDTHASVDISWAVALFLLGLMAVEMVLRLRASAA